MRPLFILVSLVLVGGFSWLGFYHPAYWTALLGLLPLVFLGLYDMLQTRHTILRNFPLLGHFRYLFEMVRPEINQYFVESDTDGKPLSREQRSVVYQRSKKELDTLPFGTKREIYEEGYEWVNHSLMPTHVDPLKLRVLVGAKQCEQPYDASVLNVSAMSFGSLSGNAILALNKGAAKGNFAHNTGEGSLTPYHTKHGGDLIWQIGTGYFGARNQDGSFDPVRFQERATLKQVKMIELKLSQGAKPGHGGILPAAKVTPEIARIRLVPEHQDVVSPPGHSAFSTPGGLLEFVSRLRELSGGKPVGIKMCVGKRREVVAVFKAMAELKMYPDFITVDGGEGGTGAAPLEFSNSIGCPLVDGLVFVKDMRDGFGLKEDVKIFAASKVITGFDMVKRMALGADACYAARSMMLALGCIQALRCNTNKCPTGVATQKKSLVRGLVVTEKATRVYSYHQETVESLAEILGAMGLQHPYDLNPWHIIRRVSQMETRSYAEIHQFVEPGRLLTGDIPQVYLRPFQTSTHESFRHA